MKYIHISVQPSPPPISRTPVLQSWNSGHETLTPHFLLPLPQQPPPFCFCLYEFDYSRCILNRSTQHLSFYLISLSVISSRLVHVVACQNPLPFEGWILTYCMSVPLFFFYLQKTHFIAKKQIIWKWKDSGRYFMQIVTKTELGWLYKYKSK